MADLPDSWAGMENVLSKSEEAATVPHVDPHSPHGFIVVGAEWLRRRFRGQPNQVLRDHYLFAAANGRRYWFHDAPEVRRELGMEP